jgi:uncharacterized protein YycO
MKKKLFVIGIIPIFIFLSLSMLPIKGLNISLNSEKIKNINIKTVDDNLNEDCVPDYVKPGDLFFCEHKTVDSEPGWDHCGIYVGDDTFIEAVPGGVWRTNLTILQTWAKDITYGTVKTSNESQRQNAVEFAESQLGKPYDPYKYFLMPWFKRPKDHRPDAEAWYCSELIWAAYYNQDIDIDRSGDRYPPYVGPTEISSDDDVEMYTYHKLNRYYICRNIEWFINRFINLFNYHFKYFLSFYFKIKFLI